MQFPVDPIPPSNEPPVLELLAVLFALVLIVSVVDLVRRPVRVPPWALAPFVWVVPAGLWLVGVAWQLEGWSRLEGLAEGLGWSAVACGSTCTALAMGLGVSRSVAPRPHGEPVAPGVRDVRATVGLAVLGIAVGSSGAWLGDPLLVAWGWACLAAAALAKPDAERRRLGFRFVLHLLGVALVSGVARDALVWIEASWGPMPAAPPGPGVVLAPLVLLAAVAAGVRSRVAACSAVALALVGSLALAPRGLTFGPSDVVLPTWVDLVGNPGNPTFLDRSGSRALRVVRRDGATEADPDFGDAWEHAIDARTPLSRVGAVRRDVRTSGGFTARGFVGEIPQGALPPGLTVLEMDGKAYVGPGRTLEMGPELHGFLRSTVASGGGVRVVEVLASDRWTFQDFVSICASVRPAACMLVPD
ncbi:MAG: hypothetical protein H6737_07050 [Alphaproteobacteria bacterium]|nr:hypothetical protein [Alphaproteobacteria bacterium]